MSETRQLDPTLLQIYLSDHAAGAAAILHRLRRMASVYEGELSTEMGRLADSLEREREWILELMRSRGLRPSLWKSVSTGIGEMIGRLKLNGRTVRQSPLSPLLELELLASGLRGKRSGWRTLREWSGELGLDSSDLDALLEDVDAQIDRTEQLLRDHRPTALRR